MSTKIGEVQELKSVFKEDGLKSNPAIVANRVYHNPKYGSFSIFETLEGESKTSGLEA